MPTPVLAATAVERLIVWTGASGGALVVADPAAARDIAAACAQAQPCAWAGEGSYRLEFRLRGGRAVWLGYDPAGAGYLSSLASDRPRAWRPPSSLRRSLALYLPG